MFKTTIYPVDTVATVEQVSRRLSKTYETRAWWKGMSPTDVLVATILSQNTTDENSIRAYHALKTRYSSWQRLLRAPEEEIARVIHSGGLPNIKARRIKRTLTKIKEGRNTTDISFLRDMSKDGAQEFLTSLHGVGAKTAAVVLALAFGKETIPVDTHIHRVANRLGLVHASSPARTQAMLEKSVPDHMKLGLHHLLISHGREVCKAQRPRCGECALSDVCDYFPSALK
jgi:endonuclease-3